jgi:hypothetical protein
MWLEPSEFKQTRLAGATCRPDRGILQILPRPDYAMSKDAPRCNLCGGRLSLKPDRVHKCQNPSRSFIRQQPLDITYSDTWKTRNEVLGDRSYQEYLQSPEWAALKERASSREHFKYCWVCGSSEGIERHHTSYKWLNLLDLRNVRPICRLHHQEIHDLAKAEKISVRLATRKVFRLFRLRANQA